MSSPKILELPEEAVPFIQNHLSREARHCSRSPWRRLGSPHRRLEKMPIREILDVFKYMCQKSNEYGIRFALPEIIEAAKSNIAIGYEALSYNCAFTLALVNAGAPLRWRW